MDRLLPSGIPPNHGAMGVKSKFTPAEDLKLKQIVESQKGPFSWKEISKLMVTRTPRQCRERYKNYLSDDIKHDQWSPTEDKLIIKLYNEYGNKWNIISKYIKGRTSNAIRNRWKYLIKNGCNQSKAHLTSESSTVEDSNYGPVAKVQEKADNPSDIFSNEGLMDRMINTIFPQGKPNNLFESDEDLSIFVS